MNEAESIAHLEEALKSSQFRFGDYLDEGWRIWKMKGLSFVLYTILLLLISMTLSVIPVVGTIINSLFVSACLSLGTLLVSDKLEFGEPTNFENFFDGFQFITPIVILNLIIMGISILLLVPFITTVGFRMFKALFIDGDVDYIMGNLSFSGTMLIWLLPVLLFSISTTFAAPLIAFYNLSSWEALKMSARFVLKHWVYLLAFYIMLGIFVCLGLLIFIVGIVLTISLVYPISYAVFKDLTDLDGYRGRGISDMLEDEEEDPFAHFR